MPGYNAPEQPFEQGSAGQEGATTASWPEVVEVPELFEADRGR